MKEKILTFCENNNITFREIMASFAILFVLPLCYLCLISVIHRYVLYLFAFIWGLLVSYFGFFSKNKRKHDIYIGGYVLIASAVALLCF